MCSSIYTLLQDAPSACKLSASATEHAFLTLSKEAALNLGRFVFHRVISAVSWHRVQVWLFIYRDGAPANVAAALATTSLFVARATAATTGVDALSAAMQSLAVDPTGASDPRVLFESHVQPVIFHCLSSPLAALLDAGGSSVFLLQTKMPEFVLPFLKNLLVRLHKNSYHASLPIRDGALKCWKLAAPLFGYAL